MPGVMKYINRISRASAVVYSHQLQEEGVAQCHHPYILLICREPGISQECIAKEICVNRSNVTRQLSILEKKDLIVRVQDQKDRRIWRVYPTEKMQKLLPIVRQVMANWNEYLMADLNEEERTQLLIVLDKLLIRANLAAKKQISFDTDDYVMRGNDK